MRCLGLLGVVALAAVCAGCGAGTTARVTVAARAPVELLGSPARPVIAAPDLALRDQDGRLVRLSKERGRLVLLTFLYTGCTDVCPLIASNLNRALRSLTPAQRERVRVLAVSVDPWGDTPAAVHRFIRERGLVKEFRYLTGTKEQLAPVWQAWNVLVEPKNSERRAHSAFVWLIDARGRTRVSFATTTPPRPVAHDLRALLARA
jgi:protein SCO1/2